jgi:hypothetical protein
MTSYVLLEVARMKQEETIREAERARLLATARRDDKRPSVLKSLLLTLLRN